MKRLVLTPLAAGDLDQIWDYLAEDSIEAADRALEDIEKVLQQLVEHPGIGHLREDLADKRHRFFPVHSYLVVYRDERAVIQVIRILHASRDVQSLLGF